MEPLYDAASANSNHRLTTVKPALQSTRRRSTIQIKPVATGSAAGLRALARFVPREKRLQQLQAAAERRSAAFAQQQRAVALISLGIQQTGKTAAVREFLLRLVRDTGVCIGIRNSTLNKVTGRRTSIRLPGATVEPSQRRLSMRPALRIELCQRLAVAGRGIFAPTKETMARMQQRVGAASRLFDSMVSVTNEFKEPTSYVHGFGGTLRPFVPFRLTFS